MNMQFKKGQKILIDGKNGIIKNIYPRGSGNYKGSQHAYIWVHIPALDYFDFKGKQHNFELSVLFSDIKKRITTMEN